MCVCVSFVYVHVIHDHGVFQERAIARTWGMRAKKAKEAAEDAAVTGKK